jgi:hypothetical protein
MNQIPTAEQLASSHSLPELRELRKIDPEGRYMDLFSKAIELRKQHEIAEAFQKALSLGGPVGFSYPLPDSVRTIRGQ